MTREFEPTAEFHCYLEAPKQKPAKGIDSEVYHDGAYATKVYKFGPVGQNGQIRLEQLMFYRDLTNEVSVTFANEHWTMKLPFSKEEVAVEINPFLNLRVCEKCGNIEGHALYIPGRTLDSVPYVFDSLDVKAALFYLSHRIEQRFNVRGISLDRVNAKKTDPGVNITDMGADIGAIYRV